MTNIQTKICTRCKLPQPIEHFYPAKTTRGNPTILGHCKTCCRLISNLKYQKKQEAKLKIKVESLEGEVWMPVKDYPLYMVSNLARVKRLGYWKFKEIAKKEIYYEEILLSQTICNGYHFVTLYKGAKYKNPISVYSLVFFSFNPEQEKLEGFEIDHKDGNRLSSKLSNLWYVTSRTNSSRRSMFLKKTSKYTGVSLDRDRKTWNAYIRINSKSKFLGRFATEEEAAQAYQTALANLQNKAA